MRQASAASIGSPEASIQSARPRPTSRGSRCVPPPPGMIPSLISGRATLAVSAARMKSHIIASSQPPPRAKPATAAMTGFLTCSTASQLAQMKSCMSASGWVRSRISLMSAPAAKAFSEPVSTTQPISSSASNA